MAHLLREKPDLVLSLFPLSDILQRHNINSLSADFDLGDRSFRRKFASILAQARYGLTFRHAPHICGLRPESFHVPLVRVPKLAASVSARPAGVRRFIRCDIRQLLGGFVEEHDPLLSVKTIMALGAMARMALSRAWSCFPCSSFSFQPVMSMTLQMVRARRKEAGSETEGFYAHIDPPSFAIRTQNAVLQSNGLIIHKPFSIADRIANSIAVIWMGMIEISRKSRALCPDLSPTLCFKSGRPIHRFERRIAVNHPNFRCGTELIYNFPVRLQ